MTTDNFTEAARAEAERRWPRGQADGHPLPAHARMSRRIGFEIGALLARPHLAAQEESVLMTSREETISDRLSDAGYAEYAEDEDGGVTWVSAPLGEVLRIVSAAQEPTDAEQAARFAVESKHHLHGTQCLCGFESHRARSRTEHIMTHYFDELSAARAALSAARAARRDEEAR